MEKYWVQILEDNKSISKRKISYIKYMTLLNLANIKLVKYCIIQKEYTVFFYTQFKNIMNNLKKFRLL